MQRYNKYPIKISILAIILRLEWYLSGLYNGTLVIAYAKISIKTSTAIIFLRQE